MGTRGLRVWRYRKRYFSFYNHHDSYPSVLGWSIVKSIPKDPEEYQLWLEKQRQMVDEWDRRYEEYLSVPADIEEKKRRFHSGSDEIDHTNFADLFRDGRLLWQRPTFLDEEVAPSFLTPLNDILMEWTYTIDLEQEVFSVNNRTHYHQANLPGKDHWCFIDHQGCNNLPKDIPTEYLTSLATAEINSDTALSQVSLSLRIPSL